MSNEYVQVQVTERSSNREWQCGCDVRWQFIP